MAVRSGEKSQRNIMGAGCVFVLALVFFPMFECEKLNTGQYAKPLLRSRYFVQKSNHWEYANLSAIIDRLQWKTVAILQSGEHGSYSSVTNMPQQKSNAIRTVVFTINPLNARDTLRKIHDNMFPDINIILDTENRYLRDFILQIDNFDEGSNHTTDFRHHSKWLIVCNDILNFLQVEKDILSLENVAVILTRNEELNTEDIQSHLTLHHHPHGNVFTPVSCCGVVDLSLCYFPNGQYGYNNRRLRVMLLPSHSHVMKDVVDGRVFYKGYALDILQLIAETLNFTYSIAEPPDRSWGLLRNGTWDGIVERLNRKEIDLAACDLTIHDERAKVIDYIYPPIKTDGKTILYKRQTENNFFVLMRPLQWEVYFTILAVAIITHITLQFAESYYDGQKGGRKRGCLRWFYINCIVGNGNYVGRALLRQGKPTTNTPNSPQTAAGRLLLLSWWLFLLIMTSAYCANLVASFSAQKDIRPFSSLEELLDTDYAVGIKTGGITHDIFKKSKLPVMQKLWTRITQQDHSTLNMRRSDHVKKVKREKYAYFIYRTTGEKLLADDCDLVLMDENFSWEHLAFAVPKQSPLQSDIERVMSSLKDSGILDQLWRKWYKSRNSTMCLSERKVTPISLSTLKEGGIIVSVGILLASIALAWERFR